MLLLFSSLGCGGASSGGTHRGVEERAAGEPDMAAMRALLERYSPTGMWIVRTYEAMPTTFVFGKTTSTVSSSGDFASYFDSSAPERVVDDISTGVHEVYHALSFRLGYQLQAEAKATELVDAEGHYVGGNASPTLVRYTAVFPAREMDATFPADARATFRYSTYVSPSTERQGTQQDGVFGLLDEWTAYLHGGRTVVDFWPWVRDEAPRTREVYVKYRSRFQGIWESHGEFKLFILHYLVHARERRPDVYRGLMSNESFRRAFIAADDAWTALLASAAALEPSVVALAADRGAGNTTFHRDDAFPAVQARLASEPYWAMLAELRRGP